MDAEGRVWAQVPLPFMHGPVGTGTGSVSPGGQSRGQGTGYLPTTSGSFDVGQKPGTRLVPGRVEAPVVGTPGVVEPHELPGSGSDVRVEIKGGGPDWEVGTGAVTPRHETYYHP
jgi:hypothetical protein